MGGFYSHTKHQLNLDPNPEGTLIFLIVGGFYSEVAKLNRFLFWRDCTCKLGDAHSGEHTARVREQDTRRKEYVVAPGRDINDVVGGEQA